VSKKDKKKAKPTADPKRPILVGGFTETELEALKEAAAEAGVSRCAYIVQCVRESVGWA
jgi:hypothetical protein